ILMLLLTINSMSADENVVSTSTNSSDSIINQESSSYLISRNLFVEFGGPSFGVGIGYDQRFRPNSVFGFRTGISFTNGTFDNGGWWGAYDGYYNEIDFTGVTLPLEANAIMGKRASKFELGVGATPCILKRTETNFINWNHYTVESGVKLNIFGTLNIGYRLQRKSGFFLRTGITFLIGDLKCSPLDGLLLIPNLSLGYTIR
ncbi:MAG: PorT family protein, partial [Muribaculaceae bacterium]|nr:PorT family protein [Muribaculaceae bacterium]